MRNSVTSYINNVHPLLQRQLYTTTNELISCLIPMLNSTLTALKTPKLFSRRIDPEERLSGTEFPDLEPGPYRSLEQRAQSEYLNADGKLHKSKHVDLRKEFWDVGIQAIIQVSSIDLDTERPTYPGEEWHVQGQMVSTPDCWRRSLRKPPADCAKLIRYEQNERICATMLYCYSSSNISEASLSFRHRVSNDEAISLSTLARSVEECEEAYGIKDFGPAVQILGHVIIKEDRVISFPNVDCLSFTI